MGLYRFAVHGGRAAEIWNVAYKQKPLPIMGSGFLFALLELGEVFSTEKRRVVGSWVACPAARAACPEHLCPMPSMIGSWGSP